MLNETCLVYTLRDSLCRYCDCEGEGQVRPLSSCSCSIIAPARILQRHKQARVGRVFCLLCSTQHNDNNEYWHNDTWERAALRGTCRNKAHSGVGVRHFAGTPDLDVILNKWSAWNLGTERRKARASCATCTTLTELGQTQTVLLNFTTHSVQQTNSSTTFIGYFKNN